MQPETSLTYPERLPSEAPRDVFQCGERKQVRIPLVCQRKKDGTTQPLETAEKTRRKTLVVNSKQKSAQGASKWKRVFYSSPTTGLSWNVVKRHNVSETCDSCHVCNGGPRTRSYVSIQFKLDKKHIARVRRRKWKLLKCHQLC